MWSDCIGIIGCGFVGGAVRAAAERVGANVAVYDKFKPEHPIEDVLECRTAFVCVPTPTKGYAQDLSAVEEVCTLLESHSYKGAVVIKSTVLPGTMAYLAKRFPALELAHNPEFLTERNAKRDFVEQTVVLISTPHGEAAKALFDVYQRMLPRALVFCTVDFKTTELAKYLHNCFLATKVAFMNEFHDYCASLGADYSKVKMFACTQGKIGENHTNVPGPDGLFGFGGTCFPKDTEALLGTEFGGLLTILNSAVQSNFIKRAKKPI